MLKFQNVTKRFGNRIIFEDLSFEIKKGEITFLLGKSGTGKSVLLKSIVGLLNIDSGSILLNEELISHKSEEEFFAIRKKCGLVFQSPALFDHLNVFENIAFGLRRLEQLSESALKERVNEALEMVHLSKILAKSVFELSFGEQKRVSLARSLALKPEILLFDEPTTGLDPVMTQNINFLIQETSHKLKTTSLVVSHDIGCALDIADRIILLDQGRIVADGAPREIRTSKHPLVLQFLNDVIELQAVGFP